MENQDVENTESEELIISVGLLDSRLVEKPAPVYPELMRKAGLGGRMVVEVLIDQRGQINFSLAGGDTLSGLCG